MTAASTHTDSSLALTSMARGRIVVRAMLTAAPGEGEPDVALAPSPPASRRAGAGWGCGLAQKKGPFQEWPAPAVGGMHRRAPCRDRFLAPGAAPARPRRGDAAPRVRA
jgi:hypothetical protein